MNENHGAVCAALNLLLEPNSVAELRVLNSKRGTISGYFDNFNKLADDASLLSGSAPGIYVTLNPVNPDLLARASNRTRWYAKNTTSDADILRRRWLPIDFDPVRAAGISSTNAEHEAALEHARSCRALLTELGWPAPIFADSGNGAHLLYPVDLPNEKPTTDLLKQCMAALDLQFSDEEVKVDVTTCNPARIWKLYGTLSAKGDSTQDRPHRISKVLETPDDIQIVNGDLLAMLAAMNPPRTERASDRKARSGGAIDLSAWLEDHDLSVLEEKQWKGARMWILNSCPWNDHDKGGSAFIIQFTSGAVTARCHHNGCSEENWNSLRKLFGDDVRVEAGVGGAGKDDQRSRQADQLMVFAEMGEFFHTASGEAYTTIPVDGHRETWATNSSSFSEWLLQHYYSETQGTLSSHVVNEVISVCAAKARFTGEELAVFTRVAELNGKIYLDLADANWTVVEIDAAGWRVVADSPVKFQRPPGMKQLPLPITGGNIEELRRFVNIGDELDWKLLVAWLVAALRPTGPYPVLVLHGEQGSAKSTTARILRSLIDPNSADPRSVPSNNRDVMIAANNSWIISLDNLSALPEWLSDTLCRVSTGGGFGTRKLYSNTEETLIDVQLPCILNGIQELATKADLLDRSLILYLPSIPEGHRRTESDLWSDFDECKPRILGALLNAVSGAVERLPETKLANLPRLADFAFWASAAERSLGWNDGAFLEAYTSNRALATDLALDASPVAQAVRQFCAGGWTGTATKLLHMLNANIDEATRRQSNWPSRARSLSASLFRSEADLRKVGVLIKRGKEGDNRSITVSSIAGKEDRSSDVKSPRCSVPDAPLADASLSY